ncbi:unnamed protein product [Closterium sp. NIES-54]
MPFLNLLQQHLLQQQQHLFQQQPPQQQQPPWGPGLPPQWGPSTTPWQQQQLNFGTAATAAQTSPAPLWGAPPPPSGVVTPLIQESFLGNIAISHSLPSMYPSNINETTFQCSVSSSSSPPTLDFVLDSRATEIALKDAGTLTPLSPPTQVHGADSSFTIPCTHLSNLPCTIFPFGKVTGLHIPTLRNSLLSHREIQNAGITAIYLGNATYCDLYHTASGRFLLPFPSAPALASILSAPLGHPSAMSPLVLAPPLTLPISLPHLHPSSSNSSSSRHRRGSSSRCSRGSSSNSSSSRRSRGSRNSSSRSSHLPSSHPRSLRSLPPPTISLTPLYCYITDLAIPISPLSALPSPLDSFTASLSPFLPSLPLQHLHAPPASTANSNSLPTTVIHPLLLPQLTLSIWTSRDPPPPAYARAIATCWSS